MSSSVDISKLAKKQSSRSLNILHSMGHSRQALAEPANDTGIENSPDDSSHQKAQPAHTVSSSPEQPISERKQRINLVGPIGHPDVQMDDVTEDGRVPSTEAVNNPVQPVHVSGQIPDVSESNISEVSSLSDRHAIDPLELEQEELLKGDSSANKFSLVAVTLKEAALDSPTFRASFNHLNHEINDMLEWCTKLQKRTSELNASMDTMRELANNIIVMFVPNFAFQGLLGQDYTTLAFVRYSQSIKAVWTEIIGRLHTHQEQLKEHLRRISEAYKPYKVQFEKFTAAQAAYDQAHASFMAMDKNDPPLELQKAQKHVAELRREYLLASIKLTNVMSRLRLEATGSFMLAFSDPMQIYRKSSVANMENAVDLHRLRQCALTMTRGKNHVMEGLEIASRRLEQRAGESDTTEDITAFTLETCTLPADFTPKVTGDTPVEQFGWVFIKHPSHRNLWVRRWAFIKNGLFGWLALSADGFYVLESDKVPVASCVFASAPEYSRRGCFTVTKETFRIVVQAETRAELEDWLTVAAAAAKMHAKLPSRLSAWAPEFVSIQLTESSDNGSLSPSHSTSSRHHHHSGENFKRFVRRSTGLSRLNSFSSKSETESLETEARAPDPTKVFLDHDLSNTFSFLLKVVGSTQYIDGLSTLAPSSQNMLAPPIIPTVPMPTSMTSWAVVGYSFLQPVGFPNALTANFWGSVNWRTYRASQQFAAEYVPKAPQYPRYYPRELVAQDMIRRAMFENLNLPNEYVVTVMRGFVRLKENQWVPSRMYATNRRILFQVSIFDYASLRSVRYMSILDVECKSSVDFDDLQIIVRNTEKENDESSDLPPYSTFIMRMFIDSGPLMQRRLQYLLDNFKSLKPDNLEEIIKQLGRINTEYAHDVKQRLVPTTAEEQVLGTLWSDIDRALKSPNATGATSMGEKDAVELASAHNLGNTMKHTVLEHNFALSPRALFHTMFGDHETVFNREDMDHRLFQKLESGQWYDHNGVLERVVHAWISGIKEIAFKMYWDSMVQDFVQRIERKDSGHLYIISERRPVLKLPRGAKFHITVRYAIVRLSNGHSRLQMYADIHWKKGQATTAKTLERVMLKLLREEMELTCHNIEEAIESMEGHVDEYSIIKKFGRIKATQAIERPQHENTINVHLGRRTYFWYAVKLPLNWLINFSVVIGNEVGSYFGKVASVDRVILLVLLLSLVLNVVLFGSSSYNYWHAKWEVREANAYVDKIVPASPTAGSVFKRAIYLRDVDDAISARVVTKDILPDNLCADKFQELLGTTIYENEDQLTLRPTVDYKSHQAIEHIQALRTGLAIERNKLLTELRLLRDEEFEIIRLEFANWLETEVALCAKARSIIPDLNVDAFNHIKQYCSDCNAAANFTLL